MRGKTTFAEMEQHTENAMENRLGIFVFYHDKGNVETYVTYLLQELKKCCRTLAVVCNGPLSKEGLSDLRSRSDVVFQRKNSGFDCGAIQDVLTRLLGWDRVLSYDELLIVNDTCYGPLYPLEHVFNEMGQSKADFWGITEQLPMPVDRATWGTDTLPYHLQSYFVVFRQRLLHDGCFRSFWEKLSLSDDYYGTIKNFELQMTSYFLEKRFCADALIREEVGTEGCYLFNQPYDLVRERGLPFIKRKSIMFRPDGYLPFFSQLERERLFLYLEEQRLYDPRLIREDFEHRYSAQCVEKLLNTRVSMQELMQFKNSHKGLFIYGAGVFAWLVTETLREEGISFDGYVVSDGHRKEAEKHGKKIYELSELYERREEIGIVPGVEKRTWDMITGSLEARGFGNVFYR